ncbi:MAG: hypothetical protein D6685_13840 [Bacteroidetes bacterium]|nr:MAG: hypothetical protein D6685_13840 [Bacteroidota bacterium]
MRTHPLLLLLALLLAGCAPTSDDAFRIEVVSSPPAYVTGGDARIEVHVPDDVPLEAVVVELNGQPVTAKLSPQDNPHVLAGVVDGLPEGPSILTARAAGRTASLELTNHPTTGPLFSGPPQEPFLCATPAHRANAALGDPIDDDCTIPTVVSFLYLSTDTDDFKPFDPAGPRPSDLARTTTLDGQTVDFIVRWERGTLNRFIYSIAVLSPGSQDPEVPDLSAWNERAIYYFQGGVGIGHYQGNPNRDRMLYRHGLSRGYAILYSTGTRTSVHYDLEVGGETAIMVKDRFVSAYGKPRYTVGVGGSGGGIQQYVYGQNHPGLIDAGVPQYSYPDMITQTIHVGDCELLERYMDAEVAKDPTSKWATWRHRTWLEGLNASDTLPNPYTGRPGLTECINGWRGLSPLTMNPHYGTAPGISPEQQAAVEWTHFADAVQIYGRAEDGFAARTWDNVGVQYGLQALLDGHITPEEFLDLNARVGGWKNEPDMVQEGRPFIDQAADVDVHSARNMTLSPDDTGHPPAPRSEADPNAIEAAYRRGLVFRGDIDIPLIDWRHYLEPVLDMHNAHQSFAARRRMLDHDGDASNQVIWFTDIGEDGRPRFDQTPMAFEVIDEWMTNIAAHPERGVAGNKPARATDSCFDADGTLIYAGEDAWAGILDDEPPGPCTQRFPIYSTSRIVAGGPITGDVFKCHLQPVEDAITAGVYGAWQPTPAQIERLKAIFPTGVCDYTRGDARRPPSL